MSRETEGLLNKISPSPVEYIGGRVKADPGVVAQYVKNKTVGVLRDVLAPESHSEGDKKDLEEKNLPIRIAWINRTPDGYRVVMTGMKYNPETVDGDLEEISKLFSNTIPDISSMLMKSDDIFIDNNRSTRDPIVVEDTFAIPELVATDGEYTVMTEGDSIYVGYVFNKICDFSGKAVGARIWADGQRFAFQDMIAGDEARDIMPTKVMSKPTTGSWGSFGFLKDDELTLFLPFKIKGMAEQYGKQTMIGHTIFGNNIALIVTPNIQKAVSATGIKNDELGDLLNANIYYIPAHYRYFGLGNERVDLIEEPHELRRRQMKIYLAKEPSMLVDSDKGRTLDRHGTSTSNNFCVRFNGDGTYGMEGSVLEFFGGANFSDIPSNRMIWLLMNLGFPEGGARYILNRAQAMNKVNVAGAKKPEI